MASVDAHEEASAPRDHVAFEYLKGNFFRVIHADGVLGGQTPSGGIHMAFFSERPALPRRLVHSVTPDGKLGDVLPDATVVKNSIIREMDVDVVMSLAMAEELVSWLSRRIDDVKNNQTKENAQ